MPLVIVLVVALALITIAGLVSWIRRAASCARRIEVPAAGQPIEYFHGGVMCRHLITSGTLARLEFHEWGIRLRGTVVARWIVPTWEARYDELAIAELVSLPHSRIAVWFRLRDSPDGIAFLADRTGDVLDEVSKYHVPVNRAVTRIRRVAELYGQPR